MPSRPWRILTIVLLMATIWPSPRMVHVLVADAARLEKAPLVGKTRQASGRNRISSPVRQSPSCTLTQLAGVGPRPIRDSRPIPRASGPSATSLPRPVATLPASPTNLRLRC